MHLLFLGFVLLIYLALKVVTPVVKLLNLLLKSLFFREKSFICFIKESFGLCSELADLKPVMQLPKVGYHWL